MAWIESHQALADHPKTKRLARLLHGSSYEAVGVLHFLWWWTLDYAEDGDLSRFSDEDIADGIHWPNDAGDLVTALQESGFLTDDRHIKDWDEYAGRIIDRRQQSRERQRRYRARTSQGGDSLTSIDDVSRNGHVTRDKRVSDGPTNQPTNPYQPTVPTGERARAQSAGADPPKSAVPKPNRVSEFVDAVKAIDPEAPVDISARDGKAIKDSTTKPDRLAQAYLAAFSGDWDPGGDGWLRENLSAQAVVTRIGGFEAHLRAPPKPGKGQTAIALGNDLEAQRRRYGPMPDTKEALARIAAAKNGAAGP